MQNQAVEKQVEADLTGVAGAVRRKDAEVREPLYVDMQQGLATTVQDLKDNPEKYAGRTFVMKQKEPTYSPGWGSVYPITTPFNIESVRTLDPYYARRGMNVIPVVYLDILNGFAQEVYLDPKMEVTEVRVNPTLAAIAEIANEVRMKKFGSRAIGADPEIFAEDEHGNVIPAFEFLPSHKEAKKLVKNARADAAPFWDGYQAEFNTAADTCLAFHTDSVQIGLASTLKALKEKFPNGKLSVKTTMDIPPDRLRTDDRKYVQFGCTPSKSVYGEEFPDVDPATIPFRSAGGHLHFTLDGNINVESAIRGLDSILGVIAVSLFQYYDDPRRRMLYGRAGEYRTPSYGIEYRTLSNAWLVHPAMAHFVYEMGRRVIGLYRSGPWERWEASEEEVRKCINDCDVELAHTILNRNMMTLKGLLMSFPTMAEQGVDGYIDRFIEVIFNGIHTVLTNPDQLSHRWVLDDLFHDVYHDDDEDYEDDYEGDGSRWITHSEGICGNFSRSMRWMLHDSKGRID